MKCKKCETTKLQKFGFQSNGKQRYRCIECRRVQQETYSYSSYEVSDSQIVSLLKESCGTRSIARICNISPNTVTRRILKIGSSLKRRTAIKIGQVYQVDELFSFVGYKKNRICVAYSYCPKDREVIDVVVGRRNKRNLRKLLDTLILSNAQKITTDKLALYKDLIPKQIHSTKFRGINHIERLNLTLRTHLKRLNRRTLGFTKSIVVLLAVLKIYFWY